MTRFPFRKALSVILISGVLAGGALVVRQVLGRVQTPLTWRSLNQPVRDTTAEEYDVYSTIIDKIHHEERLRVFVIRDRTAPCLRRDAWCTDKLVRNQLPSLKSETLQDYLIQNKKPAALTESFTLQRPAVMLRDQNLTELLIETKLRVDLASLPNRKIQWGKFYDRYPLAPGLISLSRVGFDSRLNQALVYAEMKANANGTWGRYLMLTKESGGWVIKDKLESWFPEEPLPSVSHGEWGTLKGRILDAKAEGLDEVQLSLLSCGWDIGSLEEALARDTVMLAEVVGKKTFADEHGLRTWYRFKIIDTLSERQMPNYPTYASLPQVPEEMQPLAEDEFVMLEINGEMEIDGVRVIQRSNGVAYSVGGTYLIFLHMDSAERLAVRSATDPLGVFLVGSDGTVKAHVERPYPLRDQMTKRFGNSIENLRTALKN